MQFGVGSFAFLLIVFTGLLLYRARTRVDAFSWALFGFFALIVACMVEVNRQIVDYNLNRSRIEPFGVFVAIPIATVVLILIYVAAGREPALPSHANPATDLLAEETHSGRIVALFLLPVVVGPAISAALVPIAAVRITMAVVSLIGLAAIVAAWSGFQYRFFRHGFEISTLGFRLRSIPRQQIQSYAPESWSPLRGYGIRGLSDSRAYVWGNKVVRVKTTHGDVFLGHSDPARIVRDLDRVMNNGAMNHTPSTRQLEC